MKKLIALAGAAAMMLASTGVAFGAFIVNSQSAFQNTKSAAISNSGRNFSSGLVSFQLTGESYSESLGVAEANRATIKVNPSSTIYNGQAAFQNTKSAAISNSGRNYSGGVLSGQLTGTSKSISTSSSGANWATITADTCVHCTN